MKTMPPPTVLSSTTPRPVDTTIVAAHIAHTVTKKRCDPTPPRTVIANTLTTISPQLTAHIITLVANQTVDTMAQDHSFDPVRKLERAATSTLKKLFGNQIVVTGWFAGEKVTIQNSTYTLTGDPCPNCHTNPLAYGISGNGVRCCSTTCAYQFCY